MFLAAGVPSHAGDLPCWGSQAGFCLCSAQPVMGFRVKTLSPAPMPAGAQLTAFTAAGIGTARQAIQDLASITSHLETALSGDPQVQVSTNHDTQLHLCF